MIEIMNYLVLEDFGFKAEYDCPRWRISVDKANDKEPNITLFNDISEVTNRPTIYIQINDTIVFCDEEAKKVIFALIPIMVTARILSEKKESRFFIEAPDGSRQDAGPVPE